MKKCSYFWMALGMAFLLLLPIYSMAQTPLKMRLMTESGDMITTNEPKIKSFYFSPGDGTLSIVLQDSLNFTFAETDTLIAIRNPTNCTIPGDGSVSATAGGTFSFEVYSPNATVSATPIIPGGSFSSGRFQWTTLLADIGTYLAVFEAEAPPLKKSQLVVMIKVLSQAQYTLQANVSPAGGGTVTKSPDKALYSSGEQVTLTANASSGYTFGSWSGVDSSYGNTATVTTNTNKTVTANFTSQGQYTLQVNVNPAGGGTVIKSPDKTSYSSGEQVTLTANAGTGYTFGSWTEGTSPLGTSNPITTTMNTNRTITANFTGTNMTGKWATQVASATKLNTMDSGIVNTYGVSNVGINMNEKKYFLVDPKSFGILFSGSGWTHFEVRDKWQGTIINIYYPRVYKINANADELYWWNMTGAGDFAKDTLFSKTEYDNGVRFLVELSEKGLGSTSIDLTVIWLFR